MWGFDHLCERWCAVHGVCVNTKTHVDQVGRPLIRRAAIKHGSVGKVHFLQLRAHGAAGGHLAGLGRREHLLTWVMDKGELAPMAPPAHPTAAIAGASPFTPVPSPCPRGRTL